MKAFALREINRINVYLDETEVEDPDVPVVLVYRDADEHHDAVQTIQFEDGTTHKGTLQDSTWPADNQVIVGAERITHKFVIVDAEVVKRHSRKKRRFAKR